MHTQKKRLIEQAPFICEASTAAHDGITCFFLAAKLSLRRLCGTRLNQKSDNFKVPFLSCYEQRSCSIMCAALVFVGTRPNQKSDNVHVPFLSCSM